MRKAHREAAKALYEERNRHLQNGKSSDEELYVDLHGKLNPLFYLRLALKIL